MSEVIKICPVCKKEYTGHSAISRKDNKTEICPECGAREAIEAYKTYHEKLKITETKKSTKKKKGK